MLGHYLRLYFRQISRQKVFQSIGVVGLAIGVGAVIIITAWIRFETSYDSFHANSDRLYRIYNVQEYPTGNLDVAVTPFPLGPALEREFAEIEATARIWYGPGVVLSHGADLAFESSLVYADSTFFDLFSFTLVSGDSANALDRKNSAVISSDLAKRFFHEEDPVGKTLKVNSVDQVLITGVLRPVPGNSHLRMSMVVSMPTVSEGWSAQRRESWGSNGYSTYVLLQKGADFAGFAERLETSLTKFRGRESTTRLYAQLVTDIHLGPSLVADNSSTSDPRRLGVFAAVALLVLLIACINYINLATARAGLRFREFGVRACLGAAVTQIRRQIIAEALAASGIAVMLALVLVEISFPYLRNILSPELTRDSLRDILLLAFLPVVWLVTGLAAGVYPAISLIQDSPSRMLKDRSLQGNRLRRALVVLQFAASVVLIVLTVVILRQQNFMLSSSLAANAEELLVIPMRGEEARAHRKLLREQLLQINGVTTISAVTQLPHQIVWSSTYNWEGQTPGEEVLFNTDPVDENFLEAFNLPLVSGRNFRQGESGVCMINESALKQIGWTDAVGKMMFLNDSVPAEIVGVIGDFHFNSMRESIAPLVLYPDSSSYSNLVLRIATDDLQTLMSSIEQVATKVLPNTPYRSFFMNQAFERLYSSEIRMQQTISFFAALAVILACLGLFGLATFSIERRTKEVGVRKVLGATVTSIISLHLRQYLLWLLAANLIAWPIAYLIAKKWLDGFAYSTDLPWWIFALAAVTTLTLALSTVVIQTVRAASANPVKSLRYE